MRQRYAQGSKVELDTRVNDVCYVLKTNETRIQNEYRMAMTLQRKDYNRHAFTTGPSFYAPLLGYSVDDGKGVVCKYDDVGPTLGDIFRTNNFDKERRFVKENANSICIQIEKVYLELRTLGVIHNNVGVDSVRLRASTGSVYLCNFEMSSFCHTADERDDAYKLINYIVEYIEKI
jgi:hypothetical protein